MPNKLNLANQKYGMLKVLEEAPNVKGRTYWKCQCDCGNVCKVKTDYLRRSKNPNCGCLKKERARQLAKQNIKSLLGQQFGNLTVIDSAPSYRDHAAWLCECSCGRQVVVNSMELKRGDTLSCGCLRSSYGEQAVEAMLIANNKIYQKEYIFSDLVSENNIPLRFDFAVFDDDQNLEMLIEYDGEQHYLAKTNNFWKTDNLEKRKQRDQQKNEYCIKNKIKLIRIPYWEKNNIDFSILTNKKYIINE